jgi:hypothetical protein
VCYTLVCAIRLSLHSPPTFLSPLTSHLHPPPLPLTTHHSTQPLIHTHLSPHQPSLLTPQLARRSLCTIPTLHCTYSALYILGAPIYDVENTALTLHCTHCALLSLCTVLTLHCTRSALYPLCTVLTIHCTHHTLYPLCTVPTLHCTH